MEIELLYLPDCRNAEQARANLRDACGKMGIPAEWREYDLSAPDVPPGYRKYGAPTILVNGKDVLPSPQTGGG